jgi:hypothetical protein
MATKQQRGSIVLLALLMLVMLFAATVAFGLAGALATRDRDLATEHALAQAREALVAYAAQRPLDEGVGPGRLPCPDADDDGWAEATCGSLSGDSGQASRLGRLPWKTLGLADLRDGEGERLWYAVSTRYKGLLNCAASPACVNLTPDTGLGTITVRDASGGVVHDGTRSDPRFPQEGGAVAVVIAPGSALVRLDGHAQHRECEPPGCEPSGRCATEPPSLAPRCDPRNYLDAASLEDNARFHDRSDPSGRAGNADGFIAGPVNDGAGRRIVNDRVMAIAHGDVMPAVMARVGAEAARCLRLYGHAPGHGGRVPWAAPSCAGTADAAGTTFGRMPMPPFAATRATDAAMDEDWTAGCTLGRPEGAWFAHWRPFVFYAIAERARPDRPPGGACAEAGCLALRDASGSRVAEGRDFVLAIAGSPLGGQSHERPGPANWLEPPHADPAVPDEGCGARKPPAFVRAPRQSRFNDVVVAGP